MIQVAARMFPAFPVLALLAPSGRGAAANCAGQCPKGYIIAYGGRRGRGGEARRRADRAKDYLVNTRDLDDARVVTVDGGSREDLTVELYIVPPGMAPPAASPTVEPAEVQIILDEP